MISEDIHFWCHKKLWPAVVFAKVIAVIIWHILLSGDYPLNKKAVNR